MQPLEYTFLLLGIALLVSLIVVPFRHYAKPVYLWVTCVTILLFGLILEGYRWQMVPAYVAVGLMGLVLLKRSTAGPGWRVVGAAPVVLLLALSWFVGSQMPVVELPDPAGPYAVGTFSYVMEDESRRERYQPDGNRVLPVNVWYPVDSDETQGFPVEPFWYEMHRGGTDPLSLIFGYLRHVDTHSHREAPISEQGPFPVLIYNPSGALFPVEQNTLLVEHLVSHGYVIFGIGHPYENRTTLPGSGTIRPSPEVPDDVALDTPDPPSVLEIAAGSMDLWRPIWETRDRELFNDFNTSLGRFTEATSTQEREAVIDDALESGLLEGLGRPLTEEALMDVYIAFTHVTLANETWVKDTQFIVDNIPRIPAPVSGFLNQIDAEEVGVLGMSLGGSVAAAFCKIDTRCVAGANLDGTEFHRNWDVSIASPFLKLHHDGSPDNNFAITPPSDDLYLYSVEGTEHMDFMDNPYFLPIAQTLGMRGSIDGERVISIINGVVLAHFDSYMKGEGDPPSTQGVPEMLERASQQ